MKVPPFYRTGLKHEIFKIGDFCNVRVGDEYLQEMADGKRRMTKSKSIRRRAHNGIHSVTGRFRMEDSIMPSHKMSCFLSNLQEMVYTVSAPCRLSNENGQQLTYCYKEWAKKGIVGRGVLIDYYSYAQEQGIDYEPWSYHKITVADIKAIAMKSGIEFRTGDILLLRTGTSSMCAVTVTWFASR